MYNIQNLQEMVINYATVWPDTVYIRKKDNLLLFNYRPKVQYDDLWTEFELMCRGLILNQKTGEVVARPFDKFFNWNEKGRTTITPIKHVFEKVDGSLGIHYREDKKISVATRGSFESDQALWATEYLNVNHDIKNLPTGWTLLFEIIYPDNKIIIDYDGWSGLVLLAIRNRFTGNYMSYNIVKTIAKEFGFKLPRLYEFSGAGEIISATETLPVDSEGWVAEFKDGQRFKFKGSEYLKMHKLLNGLSFKSILEHHQNGTLKQVKEVIPDEFLKETNEWIEYIDNTVKTITEQIEKAYEQAPKTTRKGYAIWVQEQEPKLLKYMFVKADNKDILPLIYKYAF